MAINAKTTGLKKRSIFQAIFVPLIIIMILQSVIFYLTSVYGGVENSLNQNAVDILSERMINRKNEIETNFTRTWTDFSGFQAYANTLYREYCQKYGSAPFEQSAEIQIDFLSDSVYGIVSMLRKNQVNGVLLILNDHAEKSAKINGESKYGVCIRDLDQTSNYSGTKDLLIEHIPSALVEQIGCSLDSWWEARYTFNNSADGNSGNYYYEPLNAAWENPGAKSDDLAYFCGAHTFADVSQEVVSYSIPLIGDDGKPYGVLGIELMTKYLSSLMPEREFNGSDQGCYILEIKNVNSSDFIPLAFNGALYNRCFTSGDAISINEDSVYGGFEITGRGNTALYGVSGAVEIYNNNNPFEKDQLTLVAMVESTSLFAYSKQIQITLLRVSILSLGLGILGMLAVIRRFSSPITALAKRAQLINPQSDMQLGHLGIAEIDQLVDSIEDLSRNVSRETARTEFFSRMSHDMRTPMNAIISFSSPEILADADGKQKDDYLDKIHASGKYLLGLINEVLDITKIESNKVELKYTALPAGNLWSTVTPIADELALSKNVRFVKRFPDVNGLFVMTDCQHLNQIVVILLSNAIKFTPSGGFVSLETDFISAPEISGSVMCNITVKDNGIGMSEDFLKRLYQPFEQENCELDGTGLGLSICKKLVDLMGGSIDCESSRNIGTAFHIKLPMRVGSESDCNIVEADAELANNECSRASAYCSARIILSTHSSPASCLRSKASLLKQPQTELQV